MSSGGGGGAPTTQTVNQNTMPTYLQPEVEGMIGNATQQIFNTTPNADGSFSVGSTNPYVAYGSNIQYGADGKPAMNSQGQLQYMDANGNPISNSQGAMNAASTAVAGFTPMQQQAQQGTMNMQAPNQQFNQAMGAQGQGMGSINQGMGTTNQAIGATGGAMGMTAQQAQNSWTNPGTAQSFMNPYEMQSLAPQMALLQQQQGQQQATNQGQATQAGAFGGSRMGVQNALQDQSNQLAMSNLVGQGMNQAYNTGQQQYNTQQANTLAAANQLQQGAGQIGQLGSQQAAMGTQQGNLGMNLGSLANQQQAAQLNVLNAQNTVGGQQQQQNQNIINQAISNYSQQQQYPEQQLNEYSSLLHGYAIPGQTQTSYQAAPSLASTAAGLGTAAVGLSKLGAKKGGAVRDTKGGIATLALRNAMKKG